MKITVIYDNEVSKEGLEADWGFSCLLEAENTPKILFDTGTKGAVLLRNMEKLGINPDSIDVVFISHAHWDHTGGLSDFLNANKTAKIYAPPSFAGHAGREVITVKGPTKIHENIFSTGELAGIEQSLVVKTGKGLVVITGCAHPGVVNIVKNAKELMNERIYLVMGGFHLFGNSESELREIVRSFRELGAQKVAPCHCSGDNARKIFEEEYKGDYIPDGVGKLIEIV